MTGGVRPDEPTLKRRAPAAWLRLLVGFLLLQLVGAQLWPALHHALFTHAVCAEHGELVHVTAHEDHGSGAPTDGTSIGPLNAGDDDAHDHCQLPPGTHESAAKPSDPALLGPATAAAEVPALAQGDELVCSIPLLALAPKQSPPS